MSTLYCSEKEAEEFASTIDNSFKNVSNYLVSIVRNKYEIKEKERMDMMLDVGCGSGGSTRVFAPHFKSIVAFDPSESQITLAKKIPCKENISYLIGSGEDMPVGDGCADMVVVCWSLHLMDVNKFILECKRVLKPGGYCFAYAYEYKDFAMVGEERESIQNLIHRYWDRVGVYFKESHPHIKYDINDRYQSIFARIAGLKKNRIDELTHQMDVMSLCDFKAHVSSIPELKEYSEAEKAAGKNDPMKDLFRDIKTTWKVTNKEDKEIKMWFTCSFYILCLYK